MQYKTITDDNRHTAATLALFTAGEGAVSEYQLVIHVTEPGLPFSEQAEAVFSFLRDLCEQELRNATIVFRRIFLSDAANQTLSTLSYLPENRNNVSIIEQPPLNGAKIALWAWMQTPTDARRHIPLLSDPLYAVRHGRYLHLWKGTAVKPGYDAGIQTDALLGDYIAQLGAYGCTLAENCLRTWIFVRDIDVNYAHIVKARRERFAANGLTEKTHYIASTGINGRHADPEATVMFDAYAVKGLEAGQVQYLHAKTHLSPTSGYGVTFERATCVRYGDRRHVFISGTASIDHRGAIVHPGDVGKQILRMIENVAMLLREAACETSDAAQIIVYLRDAADYALAATLVGKHFPATPTLVVHAPICRPGWLVEMECIAIRKDHNAHFDPL